MFLQVSHSSLLICLRHVKKNVIKHKQVGFFFAFCLSQQFLIKLLISGDSLQVVDRSIAL